MNVTNQVEQVVILGSGLDTRAFRLAWPSNITLYEIDQAEVIETKNNLLKDATPNCVRHTLAVDLTQSWPEQLLKQGYQIDKPTAWLLEGVLYYLKEDDVHKIFKKINHLSTNHSYLGADLINPEMVNTTEDTLAQYWHYGCSSPQDLLSQYGWTTQVVQPGENQAHYGRYTYQLPTPDGATIFLVTASKIATDSRS